MESCWHLRSDGKRREPAGSYKLLSGDNKASNFDSKKGGKHW
jgi:hypothetical protein